MSGFRRADAETLAFGIHEHIACGVPQFVTEVAVTLDAAHVELNVAAGGGQRSEGEAQRIGAVARDAVGKLAAGLLFDLLGELRLHHAAGALGHQRIQPDAVDQVDRVEHIALRLGHLVAVAVAHQAVHVDLVKGHLAVPELEPHHDHARDPEEDDIEAGHQHAGGVEIPEAFALFGPAQRGEGPERRAEPGIEHILVLTQRVVGRQLVLFAHLCLGASDVDAAGIVVPGGDAVSPPDLPADAPVLDVAHPLVVGVLPVVRHELDAALLDCLDRGSGQRRDLHVPLIGEERLDDGAGAVAAGHHQLVVDDLLHQTQRLQIGDDPFARLEPVQTDVGGWEQLVLIGAVLPDDGVAGKDVDQTAVRLFADLQCIAVAQPDFVVVEVVCRGDLDAAGAEFGIGVLIGDNGDAAAGQRQFDQFTDHMFIALVLGIDRDCAVTQHGLRACGGDHQMTPAVAQGVAHVPHESVLLLVQHFEIGDGGVQFGIPVDQAFAAVDQSLFVEADKNLFNCVGEPFVHGEAFVLPIQ